MQTLENVPDFQAEYEGSIPFTRSIPSGRNVHSPQTTIMSLLSGTDHDLADTCEQRDLDIAMASFPVASRSSC